MRERSGADGGGACAGGAEGRAGVHGQRWASARARRRRLDVQASGGEWWRRGGERRRENEVGGGWSRAKQRGSCPRARHIYDRWARDFL